MKDYGKAHIPDLDIWWCHATDYTSTFVEWVRVLLRVNCSSQRVEAVFSKLAHISDELATNIAPMTIAERLVLGANRELTLNNISCPVGRVDAQGRRKRDRKGEAIDVDNEVDVAILDGEY
jgi:hypothetical protein